MHGITRTRLNQIVKEELQKLNEEVDAAGIRDVVNSASKLLDALAAFKKDAPPTTVSSVSQHVDGLTKSLEDMVSNPGSYVVKPSKVISLRKVKEGVVKEAEGDEQWAGGYKSQEIAYRLPGKNMAMGAWKRKVVKSEAEFDKVIEKLQARDADIETRNADGSSLEENDDAQQDTKQDPHAAKDLTKQQGTTQQPKPVQTNPLLDELDDDTMVEIDESLFK